MKKMSVKCGLVLEGGAMRGMFTAGVLDVMMENGITFDGIIGVSAGAVFGCNYKSRQIGRTIRYNTRFCRDKRYCSLYSLLKTGDLYGADFCYRTIPNELDVFDRKAYANDPTEFYIVATDTVNGKPIYRRCDNGDELDLEWYRASASMPLVSKTVEIGEYKLLDGGITDPIPLKHFEEIGFNKNVVVLTQPIDYKKTRNCAIPLIKLFLKKYPLLISAMEERHNVYNAQTEYVRKRETDGDAFVIRPPQNLDIGHMEHDSENLVRVYEIGRKTCEEKLTALKTYLDVKEMLSE